MKRRTILGALGIAASTALPARSQGTHVVLLKTYTQVASLIAR